MFGLRDYAAAANLTDRSIQIGTAVADATTNYNFDFSFTTTDVVGSIVFEYCSNTPLFDIPCSAPDGLDASGASLSSQSGETGFSMHANTSANRIVISRVPAATAAGAAEYNFSGVVNPDTANDTTYVRISTHAGNDGTGANVDEGSVAFSLSANLAVNAFVPPYLALCVGVTVAAKCGSSSGSGVNLGNLSPNGTKTATTQFAAATNDESGYTLSVLGTTMTSGNNAIKALSSPTISIPGNSQFGINLRNNSSPNVGKNKSGAGTASATSGYSQVNRFKFQNGGVIAKATTSTNYNRFTVSYLANVPDGQAAGFYSTTLTYLAFATF
jgi:hypothetical protein